MNNPFVPTISADTDRPSLSATRSSNEAASFECNICFELAHDPIVTLCGHLFCWPCLYKWLHHHAQLKECPVCKAPIEEEKLVPLYGRGKVMTDPRSTPIPRFEVPNRPTRQRPDTASLPDHSEFTNRNPNNSYGANTRASNYTFSAAIGGMLPYLNFQVHGYPNAIPYVPAAAFPFGYQGDFHAGSGTGLLQPMTQRQQLDFYFKALLIIVGALLTATIVWF